MNGDEVTFKLKFRMSWANVQFISQTLEAGGYCCTNVTLRGVDLKAGCLSVRSKIKGTIEQRLRQRLSGGKFEFLLAQLPDFCRRS